MASDRRRNARRGRLNSLVRCATEQCRSILVPQTAATSDSFRELSWRLARNADQVSPRAKTQTAIRSAGAQLKLLSLVGGSGLRRWPQRRDGESGEAEARARDYHDAIRDGHLDCHIAHAQSEDSMSATS